MADLSPPAVTLAGRKVLAQAQTGLPLHITRTAVGDGILPDGAQAELVTELVHHVKDLPINSNKIIGDGTTKLEVMLQNEDLTEMFEFREIGVFARDNDDDSEILYAYSNSGEFPAAYIPAGGGPNAVNLKIGLITVIKQAANVVVDITDGWGYVSHEEWNEFQLNLYGPYAEPPAFLWTADSADMNRLRRMPAGDLVKFLVGHTAPDGRSVLLGFDPITQILFGYPLGKIVSRADHLFGGDPSMTEEDYPDGRISGGDPSMAPED
ncbi:MAG: phage tail protein, partial [Synergistaceae bacterium]|nr:phage tail protein [Synergistaceae bacterium]